MENKKGFKIVFIGSSNTGKTCIIDRLLGKYFINNNAATNGPSYSSKSLILEGRSFIADIWDTAGVEKYRPLTKFYLKDAKGVFVVYDITSKDSFDAIDEWIGLLKEVGSDVPMVIIGNKYDKEDERVVNEEDGELKAEKYGADYIETSALNNNNIEKAFYILMRKVTGIADFYKNKIDKYKKDYDTLKKNYDKLKVDNNKLKDELNKTKYTFFNFEDKAKKNLSEINNLKNIILQKDDEINILNLKLKNFESFSKKKSFNNNDIISVHFISSDQNINCPIKCLKTDTFAEVEEKLYQKYQEYRETNNKFVLKGITIMRFKKIIENNIIDGDKIELIKFE